MIELVKQQCNQSCGIACVAMVAGKSFDEIAALTHRRGLSPTQLDGVLTAAGVKFERQLYPDIAPHQLYIVTVASLNFRGGMHYVVFETLEDVGDMVKLTVYDPARDGSARYGMGDGEQKPEVWAEVVRIIR